ncbi:hypothetical protein GF361_00180 [Candidatus Woesearchaeota archaeon]|nr:hypothetical protein [Candidatus Woesearchaeota archaeon]
MPLDEELKDIETKLVTIHIKKEELPDKLIEIGEYLKKVPYKGLSLSISSACNYNGNYTMHYREKVD